MNDLIVAPPGTHALVPKLVHKSVTTPIGELRLVAADGALVGVYLPGHAHTPAIEALPLSRNDVLDQAERELGEYFRGERRAFTTPLAPRGTTFQLRVWSALRRIPYGETRSYVELARELGSAQAVRAVGAANGKNPLSIFIPCHRVIGKDGTMTGYAGGVAAKAFLLALERRVSARPG